MKKTVSVLLAAVLLALPLAFCAYAADNDQPTNVYYITPPAKSYMFTLTPCEGYEYYVKEGDDFKFTVEPKDGYSLEFAVIYYYATNPIEGTGDDAILQTPLAADDTGVYTIERVSTNLSIVVTEVIEKQQATLFSNLRAFLHLIFAVIARLFGFDIDAIGD